MSKTSSVRTRITLQAEHQRGMRYAKDAVAISRSGLTFHMKLPKRYRFVVCIENHTPEALPIDAPGTYEMSFDALVENPTFPILVFTVPRKDAEMFARTSIETVNGMIANARTLLPHPLPN